MRDYRFTATDRWGNRIEGQITADNSAFALSKVRNLGYEVASVRPVSPSPETSSVAQTSLGQQFLTNFFYPLAADVRLKDLYLFYRELSDLMKAGVPLYQAMAHLEGQLGHRQLKPVLRDCQRKIERGEKPSEVFAAYPHLFTEVQIAMLRVGEQSGCLDTLIRQIADFLNQELTLRRLLSRRTIYTKCVFISGVFLIPTFFSFVMGASAWQLLVMNFQALVPLIILTFFLCLFSALFRTSHPLTEVVLGAYERLKWNLPGFQVVTRKFAWAKFGQAFGTLYRVGVPLSTAIALALKASGSRVLADVAPQITQDIEQGLPLSYAFRCSHRFPDMFLEMLTTGETTGEVDTMVQKAAQVLSEEAETRSVQLAHAAAELFFLFIAFILFRGLLGL